MPKRRAAQESAPALSPIVKYAEYEIRGQFELYDGLNAVDVIESFKLMVEHCQQWASAEGTITLPSEPIKVS